MQSRRDSWLSPPKHPSWMKRNGVSFDGLERFMNIYALVPWELHARLTSGRVNGVRLSAPGPEPQERFSFLPHPFLIWSIHPAIPRRTKIQLVVATETRVEMLGDVPAESWSLEGFSSRTEWRRSWMAARGSRFDPMAYSELVVTRPWTEFDIPDMGSRMLEHLYGPMATGEPMVKDQKKPAKTTKAEAR